MTADKSPGTTNRPTGSPADGAVLTIGRIYADLVFTGLAEMPVLGRERFAEDFAMAPGGGAPITAAYLAALGRPARLVARLGVDPLSAALEAPLAATGIDLGWLERSADAGPQLTVAMACRGDRAFLSRRAGHALPATLDAALAAPGARHLHIAEYATLAEIPGLVGRAKAAGLTVSLDPSWDDSLIADGRMAEAARGVDVFMPNAEEALAITGRGDLSAALDALSSLYPLVVLKQGGDGATAAAGGERIHRPALPAEVLDTTGAGDAFDAGFLDRWLTGAPLAACLDAGIRAGTAAVATVGGMPRPGALARA